MSMWEYWHWREALWLWLAAYPLLIWLWAGLQALWLSQPWLEPKLLPWMRYGHPRQLWRWLFNPSWLWSAAWVLLAIALAGPRLPQALAGNAQHALRDVMVVMDLSRSMTATDIRPSRLARSKQSLQALLRHSRDTRYGLILYGLKPHLMFPLTPDRLAAAHYLNSVEHGLLPGEGSVVSPALGLAQAELAEAQTGNKAGRVILWISDGDVTDLTALEAVFQRLQQQRIKLIIYAVGSVQGSGLQTDEGEWLQHEGQAADSALPAKRLQQLARSIDAIYLPWGSVERDWRRIYEQGIVPETPTQSVADDGTRQWQELYAPFLYAGLGLLLLSLIGYRSAATRGDVTALLFCIGLWGMIPTTELHAAEPDGLQDAYRAYQKEDYELAWQRYAGLPGYAARMGQAQAAYQMARYGAARQQYVQAFMAARTDEQRADALFTMANSAYQMGDYSAAAAGYEDVLRYRPGHAGAIVNLDYARALQEEVALFRQSEAEGAGRGPRTADAESGEDFSNRGVSLGEGKTEPVALFWSDTERKALVIKGVEFAQLASQAGGDGESASWQYDISDPSSLQQAHIQPIRDQKLFWRRVFASEEGLAAPPAEPQSQDGVAPW